ncbi:defective in cullin neddylation protein AAR3-like isoform X3 [Telopea speciosissima]|uniref:defective in cullin neddylation protein AAR3-like isoform X3 n=1 Tax=Telopea speciosissima TaxID=54955 RepID=UPI001CC45C76|nr:defective in cullin neddylation protein AAR3-like isoform X3 [Telopea speciosissima]
MDSSVSNPFDIFEIYRRYCDITSGNKHAGSREALAQLLKLVESRVQKSGRSIIFDDLSRLMLQLNFMVDSCEFTRFYDFVFFVCRENVQKNITVTRAIIAWRLVLAGRFRLLNQWCEFVEKNQRHNISEDTWQQVLAFSRCVHEDLEGYDPKESHHQIVAALLVLVVTVVKRKLRLASLMILYMDLKSLQGQRGSQLWNLISRKIYQTRILHI